MDGDHDIAIEAAEPVRGRARGERGGGAQARRALRGGGGPSVSMPFIQRNINVYEVLNEEALALVEANADIILEEIGIEFRDDAEALDVACGGGQS
jgi:trimethylamine---corrinoid protein Co-methyltransferase